MTVMFTETFEACTEHTVGRKVSSKVYFLVVLVYSSVADIESIADNRSVCM